MKQNHQYLNIVILGNSFKIYRFLPAIQSQRAVWNNPPRKYNSCPADCMITVIPKMTYTTKIVYNTHNNAQNLKSTRDIQPQYSK